MYFRDLSKYDYHNQFNEEAINVGWLGQPHSFETGEVSEEFLERLWAYLRYPVRIFRGFHTCEFCKTNKYDCLRVKYKGEERKVGYYEIRVFSKDGKVYAAPSMILHYIMEHNYMPPEEFINAVIEAGDISNEDYYNKVLEISRGKDFWLSEDRTICKESDT